MGWTKTPSLPDLERDEPMYVIEPTNNASLRGVWLVRRTSDV
jgi:hypothetical protein